MTHLTDRMRWPSYLRRLPGRERIAQQLDHAQRAATTANPANMDKVTEGTQKAGKE
jgi:hypothetical protein